VKLLVDFGNSRLKWACYADGTIGQQGVCECSSDSFTSSLNDHWSAIPAPTQLVYCTVTKQSRAKQLEALVRERWRIPARRLVPRQQAFGVHCNYRQPSQLGADRWAALIGAYTRYKSALCVVDCGTAVTVDALDAGGWHQGGLIIPGPLLMRQVLGDCTGGIGQVDAVDFNLASVDTPAAVSTGCALAQAAFIDRAVRAYQDGIADPMRVLLTGGDAVTVLARLESEPELIPELVLLGLAECAELDV